MKLKALPKYLPIFFLIVLCLALAPSLFSFSSAVPAGKPALIIEERYSLPIPEISGISWRTHPTTGKRELLLVSDREYKLYVLDWAKRALADSLSHIDLQSLVPPQSGSHSRPNSQWESVSSDASGRIFVLQENPSRIFIFNPELTKLETTIDLTVPDTLARNVGWDNDSNSKGEGLILMSNGHILVIKEKNPLLLIEFIPPSGHPMGYLPKLALEKSGAFPLPKEKVFKAAHYWKLNSESSSLFRDSSGINPDGSGSLYLLSDESRRIGKIGSELDANRSEMGVIKQWDLSSEISKPEGMVIDENNRPIISADQTLKKGKKSLFRNRPNLFVLSPML